MRGRIHVYSHVVLVTWLDGCFGQGVGSESRSWLLAWFIGILELLWNAAWEQRKHGGSDDELDSATLGHWLRLDDVVVVAAADIAVTDGLMVRC